MNLHSTIIVYHVVDKKTGKVILSTRDEKEANVVSKYKRGTKVRIGVQA